MVERIELDFKLAIGIPLVSDRVHTQFLDSFIRMRKGNFVYCRPMFPTGFTSDIASVRNSIVEQAVLAGCTHLLFMDTDQNYPIDVVEKLVAHKKDIIGAKVHMRYPPFMPTIYRYDKKVEQYYILKEEEWVNKEELIEVDATGTGCILIKTDVFLDMKQPWFEFIKNDDGVVVGEDINFCKKAKDLGYNIYIDPSIKVNHMSNLEVDELTYFIHKKLKALGGKPNG